MNTKKRKSTLRLLILTLIAMLLSFFVLNSKYKTIIVSGDSMKPTLKSGDFLVVDKFKHPVKNDIVIVVFPGDKEQSVKRVAFTNEDVYVSYEYVGIGPMHMYQFLSPADYNRIKVPAFEKMYQKITLSRNHFVLYGDNEQHSEDSRVHGIIYIDNISGVVVNSL
jgi:signal peptidase I